MTVSPCKEAESLQQAKQHKEGGEIKDKTNHVRVRKGGFFQIKKTQGGDAQGSVGVMLLKKRLFQTIRFFGKEGFIWM
jgi:hypothetical protein